MIVRVHKISFSPDRTPMPKTVKIGFEGDNMVERLMFKLPNIAAEQTAQLMIGGTYANMVMLTQSDEDNRYYVDLTAELIGEPGRTESYVVIDGKNGEVWQSGTLYLSVGDVPDVETEIEQRFPTAIEQMRSEMAAHDAAMEETTENVSALAQSVQTAAENAAEAADRADDAVTRMPVIGENGNWYLWDAEKGEYVDSGKPSGGSGAVESVNGKTGAVELRAEDVGALPSTYVPPDQTAAQVGADPAGTAETAVGSHNTDTAAHGDLRTELKKLAERINAVLDSDDETLDELSEIVAYIKSNKTLIDAVTMSKVNVADIVNNLTTNAANKPLSAAQGVALKALIDAITVPTKLSDLAQDSTHRLVTDTEKTAWSAKSDFSGSYADLTGKPTIPTIPTKVSAFENDAGYLTEVPSAYITETELEAKGYLTEHQDISGKLDVDELPEAVNNALAQAKASGEFDGAAGKDGVSATHKWNGTTLTITSASGTSSANLKGETGAAGADGKTPVKGTDYYTAADKAEIVSAVIAALPIYTGEVV